MTNEEAIAWIKSIKDKYIHGGDDDFDEKRKKSLDLAIKALEVTEQVNSSHNGVQMFPKGAFKSIYNESEDEE